MTNSIKSAINIVEDPARASVLLKPLRMQILERLRQAPDSASGLARHLELPRQKINYHLRELEKKGLIEQVEERKKGNCVERIVRATAQYYLISPETLGSLVTDPDGVQDKFSSTYLVAVAARTISDLAVLRQRAEKARKELPTFTLETNIQFASAAELNAFTEELSNAIGRLVKKYHNEKARGSRLFKFVVGSYPAITKKE